MKSNSYFKEGLFFVTLIAVMIISVGVGIVSLASASSDVVLNKIIESQASPRNFSKYDESASTNMVNVSLAVENYRRAISESRKATSSVMIVYWKIEAADSLSAVTQRQFDSIKTLLNAKGDELQILAKPKSISALVDKAVIGNSSEKQDRKIQMNKILNNLELNLNQLASR